MSIAVIQKGDPTDNAVGNLWLDGQSDDIGEVIAANAQSIANGDIIVHIIGPDLIHPPRGGEVNTYIADTETDDAQAAPYGIALRSNETIQSFVALVDVGAGRAVSTTPPAPVLGEFTVYGVDDDDNAKVVLVTAEDVFSAVREGEKALATDPVYDDMTEVKLVLAGDTRDALPTLPEYAAAERL